MGAEDIVGLDLERQPVRDEDRSLYIERFIHAAIFAARPDVMAVVPAHAEDTLPFGIAEETKLRPVIHSGSFIGTEVPVWDMADPSVAYSLCGGRAISPDALNERFRHLTRDVSQWVLKTA